jgi:predicted nucleic acid-binding protein
MFLADASFIVSPFAKTPKRRVWAQNFFRQHQHRLWTTAAAFTEASHLIGDFKIVAKIISDYHFTLDVDEEKAALATLLEKYAPEMDFADATLVYLARREGLPTVFTVDHADFETYRIEGRKRFRVFPKARP